MAYLHNLVFLWFIDFASKAAASNGIVNDELVGLKAWLLVQLWSCKMQSFQMSHTKQKYACMFNFYDLLFLFQLITDLCILEWRQGMKW